MTLFRGFSEPVENWSKLPHDIIKLLPEFSSLAELKVVLYILRHTWGFKEYEAAKTITGDEFANGRKMKDGKRLDNGVGMGEPAIRDGLKRAIAHGFITVQTDKTDMARIQKSYRLNMVNEGVENQPSDSRKSTPSDMKINPRSEKETTETQLEKEEPRKGATSPKFPKDRNKWKQEHLTSYEDAFPGIKRFAALDNPLEPTLSQLTRLTALDCIALFEELQRFPLVNLERLFDYASKRDNPKGYNTFKWMLYSLDGFMKHSEPQKEYAAPYHKPMVIEENPDAIPMPQSAKDALQKLKDQMYVKDGYHATSKTTE